MGQDLFNNISNNYIYPDLPPCPDSTGGNGSDIFEFLPGQQVGIVSGDSIIAAMNLGDILFYINGWVNQTKILQPGEVIFISGLTKGISYQKQVFLFNPDGSIYNPGVDESYYLGIDLSLNYYNNFRHYDVNIHAEGDAVNEVTIANALDIAFSEAGILINTTYDASGFTFNGSMLGYQIDISNVDASLFSSDPSTASIRETLIYDASLSLPAFKNRNTAMLGYVLKVTYPTSTSIPDYNKYVEINHAPDYLGYFTPVDVSQFISPATWEPSIFIAPVGNPLDVSVLITPAVYEVSTYFEDASLLITYDVSLLVTPADISNITYWDAGSQLVDVSVFNGIDASYYDVSLYNTDASLVNVRTYTIDASYSIDTSSYYLGSGAAVDVSVFISSCVWDTSSYYVRNYQAVDVGLSLKNTAIMNAGEYLDYVQSNNLWEKVGPLQIWITAPDPPNSTVTNLIPGFYVFNPQTFSVRLDYMVIV